MYNSKSVMISKKFEILMQKRCTAKFMTKNKM